MTRIPNREEIIGMVASQVYGGRILNNAHRGNVAEMIVLSALGPEWRLVGLGWHPWDLQKGNWPDRVRIQVKQIAALQLWGSTVKPVINFDWKRNPRSYFFRDNPPEAIESEGWFCDLFVCGLHLGTDRELADQADPAQWQFLVIPTCDLKPGLNSMALPKALERWTPVTWPQLSQTVEKVMPANGTRG